MLNHSNAENQGVLKGRTLIGRLVFLALIITSLGGCVLATNEPIVSSTLCYGSFPLGVTDEVLVNTGYVVGYSDTREDPLWVTYRVFAVSNPVSHPRLSRFNIDTRTTAQVSHDDYTYSGYDRGHMAPNATIDYCYGQDAQRETFYMSNVCPQTPTLNRGVWAKLEATIRDWANTFEEVWVFSGPIFDNDIETLASGVEIPDAFYKIVVDEDSDYPHVLSFIIPQNVSSGTQLVSWLTSVDEIESKTGFDFLSGLPDDIENTVEATVPTALWPISSLLSSTPATPLGNSTPASLPSSPTSVVINEVEANPNGPDSGNEWVELYNPGTATIDIGGWNIIATHGRTATVTIPYGTTIQPHQFLVYYRTKQWLDNEGEVVELHDSTGSLVDTTPVLNDTANNGTTWSRVPDGSSNWTRQAGTKGHSNS